MAAQNITLPAHVAFIMDGNGRWAIKRKLPRTEGHIQGAKVLESISEYCYNIGIRYVTFYAFSTENWKRPKGEVDFLMNVFSSYLDKLIKDVALAKKDIYKNSEIRFIGDLSVFNPSFRERMNYIEKNSPKNVKTTFNIAVNYGGRLEIVNAINKIIGDNKKTAVTEHILSQYMYTAGQPDPDLIIRTSGEMRISNFLLWQCAYSEFYTADVYWPDFTSECLDKALENYYLRSRRMGGI